MIPPPPVQVTSDEYDGDPSPSRWLGLWGTIRRWLAILGAAVIVAAVAGLWGYSLGRGKSRGELARSMAAVDSLERARARVDTVTVRDSVQLTRWRTRWDSVRVVDTVVVDSVVYVQRDVADSVLAACSAVLLDCKQQRALADSLYRVVQAMPVPDRCSWLDNRLAIVAGYGAQGSGGKVSHGWQVTGGVRLFGWP